MKFRDYRYRVALVVALCLLAGPAAFSAKGPGETACSPRGASRPLARRPPAEALTRLAAACFVGAYFAPGCFAPAYFAAAFSFFRAASP